MSDKLHELTDAGALDPDDLVYVVRRVGGAWSSLRTTAGAIAALVPGGDGFPLEADGDAAGHKIVNLADPTNPQDAATAAFVLANIPDAWPLIADVSGAQFQIEELAGLDNVARDGGTGTETVTLPNHLGGFVSGFVSAVNPKTATIEAGPGAAAIGYVKADNAGAGYPSSSLAAVGAGSFALGYVGYGGDIGTVGYGALAGGFAKQYGTIGAAGVGAIAHGYAGYQTDIDAVGDGSFAHGHGDGGGGSITASAYGAVALGHVDAAGLIEATDFGAVAHGDAYNGNITANQNGALAFGRAFNGNISATGAGAFAFGHANSGDITAQYGGSLAGGRASGTGYITAGDYGAFAFGQADTGRSVSAIGSGAFAVGRANSAPIEALANNAAQFGPGTNAIADSLRVGVGIRLFGKAATPGVVANGDIWLGADGHVMVRTNGITKDMTNI